MGFPLVKVEAAATLEQTGWARHVFFDTGDGQLFAVWDLHDDTIPEFDPAISRGLGLPTWVNHIAFAASSLDDLAARRQRLLDHGHDVIEIDHGWCTLDLRQRPQRHVGRVLLHDRGVHRGRRRGSRAAGRRPPQPPLGEPPPFEIFEATAT